jgi:hypothetical protein
MTKFIQTKVNEQENERLNGDVSVGFCTLMGKKNTHMQMLRWDFGEFLGKKFAIF